MGWRRGGDTVLMRQGGRPRRVRALRLTIACALVLGLIGCAAGASWGARQEAAHEAVAVVLLNPLEGNPFSPDARGDDLVNLETEAQLVSSDAVLALLERATGTGLPAVTAADVTVSVPTNTQLLSITVRAASDAGARAAAQLLAKTYLDYRRSRTASALFNQTANINEQIAERGEERADLVKRLEGLPPRSPAATLLVQQILGIATQVGELRTLLGEAGSASLDAGQIVTPAEVVGSVLPTGPLPGGIAGLVLGLVCGAVAALALTRISGAVRRVEDLGVIDAAVHGSLPRSPDQRGSAVTRLRAVLLASNRSRPLVVLACTAGSVGGESEATDVIASSFASSNLETLLVKLTGQAQDPAADEVADRGLVQLLRAEVGVDDVLRSAQPHLSVLPVGADGAALDDLAAAPEMTLLLRGLRARADVVLLSGGAAGSPRSLALAVEADLVVLEVQPGRTTLASIEQDLADLAAAGSGPVGLLYVEPTGTSRTRRHPLRALLGRLRAAPAAVGRHSRGLLRRIGEHAVRSSWRAARRFAQDAAVRNAGGEAKHD